MNFLEVALIIIGIIIIVISCRLVDNSKNLYAQTVNRNFTEAELNQMKDEINKLLSETVEENMLLTDDRLSKISNEKIIAVSEFSDQILEKINYNHEEAVFLYNMLNDKEKELKSVVKEINLSHNKVMDITESKKDIITNKSKNTAVSVRKKKQTKAQTIQKNINSNTLFDSLNEKPVNPQDKCPLQETADIIDIDSGDSNCNKKILKLYSQGKSVVDISRQLDLGQGEVKLVIDLFHEKK
jgi:hypothetical protein